MSRRLELLIKFLRESVEFPHADGDTDSVSDLEFVQYLNDGQDFLFGDLINAHANFYLTTDTVDIVADQQSYTLPSNMFMGSKIKKVEYLYGSGSQDYRAIPVGTEFDLRTDYTSSYPALYCRGNSYLKLSPLPSSSLTDGLRITYTRKIKRLDIRRGVIASASKTGTTLNTITLDLTPALGKDSGTVSAARDLLNVSDYICVVDSDGTSVLDAIPIDSYNSSTGVITVRSSYTTTVAAASFVDKYVVTGDYTSTHSELPDNCERYLLTFSTLKLLRRGGNALEAVSCKEELGAIGYNIVETFGSPDDDVYRLRTDELWDES